MIRIAVSFLGIIATISLAVFCVVAGEVGKAYLALAAMIVCIWLFGGAIADATTR